MVISASFLDSAQKAKCSAGARLPIFGSSGILILKRKSLNPELEWSCQLLSWSLWLPLNYASSPRDLCSCSGSALEE